MPRLLTFSFAAVLAVLPTLAPAQVAISPEDEKRAEANVFITAKVIAIDRDRDRIEVRDNNGVKRTFVLAEDATLPTGRVKAGTEVILAVKETGRTRRVVSVQPSEPAPAARVPSSSNPPVYIPAPENRSLSATEQMAFASGTVAPSAPPAPGPAPLAGGYELLPVRTYTNADLETTSPSKAPAIARSSSAVTADAEVGVDVPAIGRAVQAYETSIARLATRAEEVDSAFVRYQTCVGLAPAAPGSQKTRSWLGIWDGQSAPETFDQCEPALSSALRAGQQVQRGVRMAEDQARRAGVLPGVRREIRALHGMDWDGWDH